RHPDEAGLALVVALDAGETVIRVVVAAEAELVDRDAEPLRERLRKVDLGAGAAGLGLDQRRVAGFSRRDERPLDPTRALEGGRHWISVPILRPMNSQTPAQSVSVLRRSTRRPSRSSRV